jgi:post-segregation antitoxin (ccd killing protein)
MKRTNKEFTDSSSLTAVRLPRDLRAVAVAKAKSEDLNFSQLMRRALRRELERVGALIPESN